MADNHIPANAHYTPTDEWVRIEGGEAVIGVTWYAQDSLNDVTFVELPSIGQKLNADEVFGNVESVKAQSDLHTPISGTVIAVNDEIVSSPELVNSDPYGRGWFIKIKPTNATDIDKLLSPDSYEQLCASR